MKLNLPYYCTSQQHATMFSASIAIITVKPIYNVMEEIEYFVSLQTCVVLTREDVIFNSEEVNVTTKYRTL
jgi:hypothetical protein